MNFNMPRTPFSTALSGSAKETEIRLKNIFSGPKKRPPALFLALMFSVCIFCGNLVSCQVAQAEQNPSDLSQPAAPAQEPLPVPKPDLNRNGVPEEIRIENEYGEDEVRFYENGRLIDREILDRESPYVYLCTLDGKDYILRCHASVYPGAYLYNYHIADLEGEFEEVSQSNWLQFDTSFSAPFHKEFDPQAIAAYVSELNGLLAHSVRLSARDGEVLAEYPSPEALPWLDSFPDVFTRDPEKSLEENLRDFQAAMTAAYPPADPIGTVDALPIDQPLEMIFLSGAGAWCTGLDLNPDGTFTADYHDSDGDIQYVCQYHGKFKDFVQLTDNSWSLTLEELAVDTKYPVGKEWDEGGFHKISSEPNGFTDEEGKALRPGARFILYSPQAQGYGPGTELYGAEEFLSWVLSRPELSAPDSTLGCWGLYNLKQEIGFFSDT